MKIHPGTEVGKLIHARRASADDWAKQSPDTEGKDAHPRYADDPLPIEDVNARVDDAYAEGLSEAQTIYQNGIESFIDERLAAMAERPGMWGTPEMVEADCLTHIEFFENFCRGPSPRDVRPCTDKFIAFAAKQVCGRPPPMGLAQWFTDPKYGCAEAKAAADPSSFEHQHWAGQQIVRFFIAWKAELKGP